MRDQEIWSERFKTKKGKTFFFDVKENENGKFVKITESIYIGDNRHKRTFITVSEDCIGEFISVSQKVQEIMSSRT